MYETDLARCAGVSGRFYRISNDVNLWKTLYQGAFEYTIPMYHPTHGKFELREPHRWRDTLNPWKESFRQLRHAVHVRPRYAHVYEGHVGRSMPHFETFTQALQFLDAEPEREKLILLHTGHYFPEPILISSPVQIIGASSQCPINKAVVIEQRDDTTVTLVEGSTGAYIGYLTLRFNPDKAPPAVPHQQHYALQVTEEASPVIDRCHINSTSSVGAAVCVKGQQPI